MNKVLIGKVGVDSGLIWIGDPCYVMGDDASHRVKDWSEFCMIFEKNGHDAKGYSEPLGDGTGIATNNWFGDGYYPVYAYKDKDGIKQIVIDFEGK